MHYRVMVRKPLSSVVELGIKRTHAKVHSGKAREGPLRVNPESTCPFAVIRCCRSALDAGDATGVSVTRRTELAAWAGLAVILALGVALILWQASRPAIPVSQYSGGGFEQLPDLRQPVPEFTYTP